MCLAQGRTTPGEVADHIERVAGDYNRFRLGRLQTLCWSCHEIGKKGIEARGFDKTIGADGWPIDPRHPVNRAGK